MKQIEPLKLVAGCWYEALGFERFEYLPPYGPGTKAILRLHQSNGTIVDLPATNDEFVRLALTMTESFGPQVIEHLKSRNWIPS